MLPLLLALLTQAAECPAPVAVPVGPLTLAAEVASTRRTLPGGEPVDISVRLYAMRGPVGAFAALADLEADDQDAAGTPTTAGLMVRF